MKTKTNKITKDMLILDLAEKFPEIIETLTFDYGMHCIGCHASAAETLEEGAKVHGMTSKEIDKMVEELNKIVSKA